jgi:hypothetical protein
MFLVEGSLDDGMAGIHITFGIFDNRDLANQHILNVLREWNCEYEMGQWGYMATYTDNKKCYYHFTIGIKEYDLNVIKSPSFI